MRFLTVATGALAALLGGLGALGSAPPPADAVRPTPLILEKNEGERRVRRDLGNKMGTTPFILKVDPGNGRSEHLIMLTEELLPGAAIPAHKHPGAEEILMLQTGTARVHLGDTVRDVTAGATVFIPPDTWISVDITGTEPVKVAAIFSEPGFEDYLREVSVREGEKNEPMSKAEMEQIRKKHPHAVIYR
jgi:quercetin dioxygenase-like cupin family protein